MDKPEAPALRLLREAGERARELRYAYHEKGGTRDAAAQLGLPEHRIVKSLVFDDGEGGAVMALMHGDERVSPRKLERMAGAARLQPSSPERAEAATGYRPGGICPFGLPSGLPVFAQQTLFAEPELYINAGERGVIAAIRPEALLAVCTGRGDLKSASQRPRPGGQREGGPFPGPNSRAEGNPFPGPRSPAEGNPFPAPHSPADGEPA